MIEVRITGEPDADKKRCYDCHHCKASVSWWCKSPEAFAFYRTKIPGREKCPFWKGALPAKWYHYLAPLGFIIIKSDKKNVAA